MEYYAHSLDGASQERWQTLSDHLHNVSRLSGDFAERFTDRAWGEVAGLLHDAGKYSDEFQRRLHGQAYGTVDHSTGGAQIADTTWGTGIGRLLGYVVAGHHGGLPDGGTVNAEGTLLARLRKEIPDCGAFFTEQTLPPRLPSLSLAHAIASASLGFGVPFFIRMLYSCVVDADFLDTERFMDAQRAGLRGSTQVSLSDLRDRFAETMQSLKEKPETAVNTARNRVLADCRAAAQWAPGLFTLTVPTGGGKTLSSLEFALEHAHAFDLDRIIYAIPFTSIVEQTAAVFKGVLGDDAVLEHHSNYGFTEDRDGDCGSERHRQERLLTQNWSAPLVVTTNVQLFESLYSDRSSRCRRLHNLAKSVIILDEAQTLPDDFLEPCLAALEELCNSYGSSVVLCTATQPALEGRWPQGSAPREIVSEWESLEAALGRRAAVHYVEHREDDELVDDILEHDQALCIVSTRKHALALFEALRTRNEGVVANGVFHLSALMCPVHRSSVIQDVRRRLKEGQRCIVVSTQLIEAGVDVDFPVVYREVAGLDSVVQAAGRCNREGGREHGDVFVFQSDEEYQVPVRSYLGRMAALGLESLRAAGDMADPVGREAVRAFFERRYGTSQTLDATDVLPSLKARSREVVYPFESIARSFRFIDDDSVSVVIPWGRRGRLLVESLRRSDHPESLFRALQQYSVSVRKWTVGAYRSKGWISDVGSVAVLDLGSGGELQGRYSELTGLLSPSDEPLEACIF